MEWNTVQLGKIQWAASTHIFGPNKWGSLQYYQVHDTSLPILACVYPVFLLHEELSLVVQDFRSHTAGDNLYGKTEASELFPTVPVNFLAHHSNTHIHALTSAEYTAITTSTDKSNILDIYINMGSYV